MVTKEIIRDKLVTTNAWVTTSRTALTGAVAASKIRYIVKIRLHGDGSASRIVNIEKLEADLVTYTKKFDSIPVAPADSVEIPAGSYSIEDPILVCEESTRPYAALIGGATGTSMSVTTKYWDNDV